MPSDTLLTERILEDEEFDMVTASATLPAPRNIRFLEELCAAKIADFVTFHSTLQSEGLGMSMEISGCFDDSF